MTDGSVDVCDADPGHEVTAVVEAPLRVLVRVWRGERSWEDALRSDQVRVTATAEVRRALPGWFGTSRLAAVAATGTSG